MAPVMFRLLPLALALTLAAGPPGAWTADTAEPGVSEAPAAPAPAEGAAVPTADQRSKEETPEQARRRELTQTHGAEAAEAILSGTVLKDMTMEQVRLARGEPTRKEVIPPDAELWHYPGGEVAFSAGKVSYVSLAAKPAAPPSPRKEAETSQPGVSEHPLTQAPAQVPAPSMRVGDSYVYVSRDPEDPRSSVSTRRTVTAANGKVILSSLNLDNKDAKARTLHYDRQWNLIASRSPNGSGRDYAPPLQYYDFPLFPGKTWHRTTTETDIKTGAVRTHRASGAVEEWETVSVPAGTFQALRVNLRTELEDPSTGERITGTDLSWYVPEVRRSVKSQTTGRDGSRRVIELQRYEVK